MILRFISLLCIIALALFAPVVVTVLCVSVYAFFFFAPELIVLGLCIDGLYGGGAHAVPWYTISALSIVLIAEWAKPRLLMYNDQ